MTDPTDTAIKNKMSKAWAINWGKEALEHRAKEMRKLEKKAREAYAKDPMKSVCKVLANAYQDAAYIFESRVDALHD